MRKIAFLDANVLAKPFTRTLIVVGAADPDADYGFTWSRHAEAEGNRHLRAGAKRLETFRTERGVELSRSGTVTDQAEDSDPKDWQILADAAAATARWIVTENVQDFGWADLRRAGLDAIHYDLFLAEHLSTEAYRDALEILSYGRVPAEQIHANVALLHPRLFASMAACFPGVAPTRSDHRPPKEVFRSGHASPCCDALG